MNIMLLFITEESQKKQFGKDPTVETSFLPDRYGFWFMIYYLHVDCFYQALFNLQAIC